MKKRWKVKATEIRGRMGFLRTKSEFSQRKKIAGKRQVISMALESKG